MIAKQDFLLDNFIMNLKQPNLLAQQIITNVQNKTKLFKQIYPKETLHTSTMLLNMENEFVKKVEFNYDLNKNEFYYYQGSKSLIDKYILKNTHLIFDYNYEKMNKINNELKIELTKLNVKNKKKINAR